MTLRRLQFVVFVGLCSVLTACSSAAKKSEVWQLYDIPAPAPVPIQQNPYAPRPVYPAFPADNDSYYQPPRSYNCNTIGDDPSCGGG